MADYAEGPFERVVNVGWQPGAGAFGLVVLGVAQRREVVGFQFPYVLRVQGMSIDPPEFGVGTGFNYSGPIEINIPPPESAGGGSVETYTGDASIQRLTAPLVGFGGQNIYAYSYRNCANQIQVYEFPGPVDYWKYSLSFVGTSDPWVLPDWTTGKMHPPANADYMAWTGMSQQCAGAIWTSSFPENPVIGIVL